MRRPPRRSTAEPTVDPTSTAKALPSTTSDAASSGEPVSNQEDLKELTYAKRLEAPEPPPEPAVEPVGAAPVPAVAETKVSDLRRHVRPKRWIRGSRRATVSSCRLRRFVHVSEADAIARRLSSKGFPSFVTTPGSSGPRVFRVRVGKYGERREAETVARRLEKEEQFKPWITR